MRELGKKTLKNEAIIQLQQVGKKFSRHAVLDKVDLTIVQGDRIALIGQNGAGKTTLIRTLLGQYHHEGQVVVAGAHPRKNRVEVLQHIGFVPQHSPPIQMSVHELLQFSAKLNQYSNVSKISQVAEDLGLDVGEHGKKPFLKLSGGMKQKLLIALALAKEPSILIMDEPAANLDPEGRKAFFLRLSQIQEQTTMILSSHRVDELLPLINRIIELDCGKIVLDEASGEHSLAGKMLSCRVKPANATEGIHKLLNEWKFEQSSDGTFYEGQIIDADRLRFLNAISHFANHISELNIT
ncbi:MAG: ABC transporter ATP-binding protein [SAR324 cluster bacterium]|nr:ABC transporter ATP-binding protein [SAR324 cluster bacterium]